MKLPIFLAILLVAACVGAATSRTKITFVSNYPVAELQSNLWFNVYSSTNLSVPTSAWPKVFTINATNTTVAGTNVSFDMPFDGLAIQRYYVATSSNSWWGAESDFSNLAWTPPPPREVISLRLDLSDAP